MQYLLVIIDEL